MKFQRHTSFTLETDWAGAAAAKRQEKCRESIEKSQVTERQTEQEYVQKETKHRPNFISDLFDRCRCVVFHSLQSAPRTSALNFIWANFFFFSLAFVCVFYRLCFRSCCSTVVVFIQLPLWNSFFFFDFFIGRCCCWLEFVQLDSSMCTQRYIVGKTRALAFRRFIEKWKMADGSVVCQWK